MNKHVGSSCGQAAAKSRCRDALYDRNSVKSSTRKSSITSFRDSTGDGHRHFHRFPKRSWNEFFQGFQDFPEFLEFQETNNNKKRKVLPRNSTCFWSEATEKSLTDSVTSRLREETEQSMTQKLQVVTSGGGFLLEMYFSQFV